MKIFKSVIFCICNLKNKVVGKFLIPVVIFLFAGFVVKAQNLNGSAAYYISPSGDDGNNGTISKPFRTIKAVEQFLNNQGIKTDVTIYFRAGTYFVSAGIHLKGYDSSHHIIFCAYGNETVNITGSAQLDNSKFQLVSDNVILKRLPPAARGHVYFIDLKAQGITNVGTMKKNGFGDPLLPSSLELFYNDQPLTLARWPNSGLLGIKTVVQKGDDRNVFPVFTYASDHRCQWESPDIWVAGQFSVGWAYNNVPVEKIDPDKQTVYLNSGTHYGIFPNNDQTDGNVSAANSIRGFYFYNILEELDMPGEWWLDTVSKYLYLWPTSSIQSAKIQVSLLEEPFFIFSNVNNIQFKNLNFSCSRSSALSIDHSRNIVISHCTFSNLGLQACSVIASTEVNISDCKFINLGAGGLILNGGDRKKLLSSNNIVKNCEFSNFSRLYQSFSPAININGVGNSVLHCYIHDAPDQAIMYRGNNHNFSYNHIQHVCYGFSDVGAVGTGRDPSSTGTIIDNNFFDDIRNPVNGMITAVYIDDGSGGITVNNNLFYECGSQTGFGGVHINGGSNNQLNNNIFVNCGKAFSNSPWPDQKWINLYFHDPLYLRQLTSDVDIRSAVYLNSYPWLKDFYDSSHIKPRINYIRNTICYHVPVLSTGSGYQVGDNYITQENPGFKNPESKDFQLVSRPQAIAGWSGWTPVDFSAIGIESGR
jgi:Right handed beta helix region